MSPQDKVQGPNDVWTPEPELRDVPPRRVGSAEFPEGKDLNRPNSTLFLGLGGGCLAVGLVLFIVGMAGKGIAFTLGGLFLAACGTALLVYYPTRLKAYMARAENLVTNGVPVIARILTADNMTGDSAYGRMVKYQVVVPGGDLVHRSVNADERLLPRRIPGDATALVDMQSGDVELYCVLPYRALEKAAPAVRYTPPIVTAPVTPVVPDLPIAPPTPTPAMTPGTMGTLGGSLPPRPAPAPPSPAEPEPAPAAPSGGQTQKQEQKSGTTSGLPWE